MQALGAEVAEVFFSTFYEYRPEFSRELARKLNGLKINSFHTMPVNYELNLFNSTRRVRGDGYYWLDQVCRSAQLLGCKNYTFHGFARIGNGKDDFGCLGERLREAADFVKGYGVQLCLENTSYYAYNRPGFFREMKERCPDLMGVFDIKQARRSGYPYAMYLHDMEGSIAYAHLSDVDGDGHCRLPGKGVYDFVEILKRLKGCGFDGNIIIEVYRGDYTDHEELKQSKEFLSELCYKLG